MKSELKPHGGMWLLSYENDFTTEHYGYNEEGTLVRYGLGGRQDGGNTAPPTRPILDQDVQVPGEMLALGDGLYGMKEGEFIVRSAVIGHGVWSEGGWPDDETKRSRRRTMIVPTWLCAMAM